MNGGAAPATNFFFVVSCSGASVTDAAPGSSAAAPRFDVRCAACGMLLGRFENGKLHLRRGSTHAVFEGSFQSHLYCSRPTCRKVTVFAVQERERARAPPV